jgi:hypothetical protein
MRRTRALAAAASLCLVVAASACSGQDEQSEEELVAEISESLRSGGQGFDEEAADCFAEIVVDEVGVEALRDVDLAADEPPAEIEDELATATIRAADECELSGDG